MRGGPSLRWRIRWEHLRGEMRQLVRELQQRLRITAIFVTHDQREAFAVADRVALLLDGRIEQTGAPRDLVLEPLSAQAAQFFGWKLLPGEGKKTLAFRTEELRLCNCENAAGILSGTLETWLDFGTRRQWRVRAVVARRRIVAEARATLGRFC